uniref:Uncharacterized protein n=1 Tax=Serinus canaria TaxID=9135 RepID=A0A8C9MPF1_SERCA
APFSPPPTKPQQPLAPVGPLQPSQTPPVPSTAGQETSAKPNGNSPPPSPPPAYHPPPPPAKKVEGSPQTKAKKEPVSRSKSGPVAKEDASLPIVTPSLLQMVRLRSVSVEPAAGAGAVAEERPAPQKPVRRSLSTRQPPPAQDAVPSKQLLHAVHLKAAALASGEPGAEGPTGDGQLSPRSKSPASTASFIFAKSSRKLVIETASSPEAQADLKKNLVAELMNFSGQRSAQAQRKPGKIPPPVAKKPSLGSGPAPSPKAAGTEALGSPVLDGDAKVEESRTKSELEGTEGRNGAEPPAQSLPAQGTWGGSHGMMLLEVQPRCSAS